MSERPRTRAARPQPAPADGPTGVVVSHLGIEIDVEVDGVVSRRSVKRKAGIVVGDVVRMDGPHATALPRRTELLRASPHGGVHVVAANLDVLFIVVAVDPPARQGLVDRAAVAARRAGIQPVLVINKIDLPDDHAIVEDMVERVGGEMPCFPVSANTGEGIDALAAFLRTAGRGALLGSSGVGKTSLFNRLVPGAAFATKTLSTATGAGRHTTTTSLLHRLTTGGELVDTPGIREFGLVDVDAGDLAAYFPGFAAVDTACRFRDCRHEEEPGCAILAALEADVIPAHRYVAYRTLLAEIPARRPLPGKR